MGKQKQNFPTQSLLLFTSHKKTISSRLQKKKNSKHKFFLWETIRKFSNPKFSSFHFSQKNNLFKIEKKTKQTFLWNKVQIASLQRKVVILQRKFFFHFLNKLLNLINLEKIDQPTLLEKLESSSALLPKQPLFLFCVLFRILFLTILLFFFVGFATIYFTIRSISTRLNEVQL